VLAILIALASPAAAQADRPAKSAPPGAAAPKAKKDVVPEKTPMVFYVARGEPNECGQGCSEWIAAEGYIDLGAAHRLRTFLKDLGRRQLPIFFYSPGGIQAQALAMGRLMRQLGMTAGVAETVPAGCMSPEERKTCDALKRSRQALPAELHSARGRCSSACVYALIGAKVRDAPPGARLGVHSGKLIYYYSDGRVKASSPERPSSGDKIRIAELDTELRRYIRDMGIDTRLFEVASKVPHERVHYLSRDEIAGFGIDAREFQETRWTAMVLSPLPLSVFKFLVEAKGTGRKEFRVSVIRLACAGQRRAKIEYYRGLGTDQIGAATVTKLVVGDRSIALSALGSVSNIDAIDTNGLFDIRLAVERLDLFEAAALRETIEIIEADPKGSATSPRVITLSTSGLARALERLRPRCDSRA